jgi:hypothetical protein
MLDNGIRISVLITHTMLSRELIHNGTTSLLGELLKQHLSKCTCHGSALDKRADMFAMATTCLSLSILTRDMDDVGMASANVEFCIRYVQSHELGLAFKIILLHLTITLESRRHPIPNYFCTYSLLLG